MEASLDQIRNTSTQNDTVQGKEGVETLRVWDFGSPLYDLHELVSVSFIIEKHFMVLPGASSCGDSKRFKEHSRAPICSVVKVAKAVNVVSCDFIDGCGGGGVSGGGCGWMLVKKWRTLRGRGKCNKKVSNYKLKKSFARLIRF